jgi:hypothetical protein
MPFGKYRELTLPQVMFVDPDYFFWLREEALKGALAMEAEHLAKKACRIRIPREPAEAFMVEYRFEPEGQTSSPVILGIAVHRCRNVKSPY